MRALTSVGIDCFCVGWDRASNTDKDGIIALCRTKNVHLHLIGVMSSFGSGIKNASKIVEFGRRLHEWLIDNADMYDAVHACDLDTGFVAKLACKITGKPFVYDIFDFYADSRVMPSAMKWIVRRLEFEVINHARATIICTDQRAGQIEGSKPNQVIVVENTPELVSVPKSRRSSEGGMRLAYVGVLTGGRYLDRVLEAADSYDDLILEIGGFGPLQEEVSRRASGNPRVVFHGKVPYSETLFIESNADVMLGLYDPAIANHRMAAPNKYYESLMLGTPLIAVEGTSVANWVLEERTGVVLPPSFTCEELHAAVMQASSDNQDCSVTKRQQDLYHHKHSWTIMEKRLQDLYSDISIEIMDGSAQ